MIRTEKLGSLCKLAVKYKYALLVLLFGLLLIMIPSGGEKREAPEQADGGNTFAFELAAEEEKLETMFAAMDGVGRVKVALTLKSGAESVYALDRSESLRDAGADENASYEKDSESRPVLASTDSGSETPLTVKEYYPEFRGALVICDGADDPNIKLQITEAIRSLTGVTSDNITVIKMKG